MTPLSPRKAALICLDKAGLAQQLFSKPQYVNLLQYVLLLLLYQSCLSSARLDQTLKQDSDVACLSVQDVLNTEVVLQVRPCLLGEIKGQVGDVCDQCPDGQYSLDQSDQACTPCPVHAICQNGSMTLIPEEGFWHSAANSTLMHSCPNPQACRCALAHLGFRVGVSKPVQLAQSLLHITAPAAANTMSLLNIFERQMSLWQKTKTLCNCVSGYQKLHGEVCGVWFL